MARAKKSAPWKRPNPKPAAKTKRLTPAQKSAARKRAQRAGRPYPNLVDNMAAARKAGSRKSAGKRKAAAGGRAVKSAPKPRRAAKSTRGAKAKKRPNRSTRARKAAGRKSTSKPAGRALRDPRGGLSAAGRAAFRRSEGSHLKAGVKKAIRDMTPAEMRRKGSWAVRFYGRAGSLPPLENARGEPTRFALTAAAWGEPVPRTARDARAIAARGRRLLARYHARTPPR